MKVRVDEARNGEAVLAFDQLGAVVVAIGADDAAGHDGDVGVGDRTGDHVQQAHVLDHDIGGDFAGASLDHSGEELGRDGHGIPGISILERRTFAGSRSSGGGTLQDIGRWFSRLFLAEIHHADLRFPQIDD